MKKEQPTGLENMGWASWCELKTNAKYKIAVIRLNVPVESTCCSFSELAHLFPLQHDNWTWIWIGVTQTQILVRLPDKNPSPFHPASLMVHFSDASRVKLNMNTSSQERFLQWKKKMALETWNIQNVDVINMNYESSFQAERWGIKWWHKATQKSEWWWPCPAITTHVHLLLCMWL